MQNTVNTQKTSPIRITLCIFFNNAMTLRFILVSFMEASPISQRCVV